MEVFKKIEAAANIAIIALVVLFGWTVFRGNFGASPAVSATAQASGPKVGMDLSQTPLKDVDWTANKNTLVLGLQTTCHYCTESGPFFQKLALAASGSTKIVAVLPQSIEQSKEYLSKLGVRVDEVRTAPLSSISVSGTPTMMLVDEKGVVKNVWVGKLPDEQQSQVLSAISPRTGIRLGGS
jgi:thioredoxin-related protein